MAENLTNGKSTSFHSMALCCQETNHYMSHYWHSFMSPYAIAMAQWVKQYELFELSARVFMAQRSASRVVRVQQVKEEQCYSCWNQCDLDNISTYVLNSSPLPLAMCLLYKQSPNWYRLTQRTRSNQILQESHSFPQSRGLGALGWSIQMLESHKLYVLVAFTRYNVIYLI